MYLVHTFGPNIWTFCLYFGLEYYMFDLEESLYFIIGIYRKVKRGSLNV